MRRRHARPLLLVCALSFGCGVGIVDSGEIPETPELQEPDDRLPVELDEPDLEDTRAAASATDATATATEVTFAGAEGMIDAEELAFLQRLNAYRASQGLAKLRVSIALTRASQAHSADMAAQNYFSHTSKDGTSFSARVKRYYSYNTYIGENIAKGYETGDAVFEGWKASTGHRANMLSNNFTVIGIARVADAGGRYYWTTDFGGYRDALLSAGFSSILSNGGFESASVTTGVPFGQVRTLGRWHLYAAAGGSSTRREAAKYSGSYGLRHRDPTPGAAAATQLLRAANGVQYAVKAQARQLAGPAVQRLYLDFLDSAYARIAVYHSPAQASSAWHAVSTAATSPAKTRFVRIIIYGAAGAADASGFDWDAVTLKAY